MKKIYILLSILLILILAGCNTNETDKSITEKSSSENEFTDEFTDPIETSLAEIDTNNDGSSKDLGDSKTAAESQKDIVDVPAKKMETAPETVSASLNEPELNLPESKTVDESYPEIAEDTQLDPKVPEGSNPPPNIDNNLANRPGEPPELDLATVADNLGITEEELLTALGEPGDGPPDFSKAAEELGITESELLAALAIDQVK